MAGEALVESGREETMTNGDDSSSSSSSTAMKRKHENESLSIAAAPAPTGTQQQDILEVLKRFAHPPADSSVMILIASI